MNILNSFKYIYCSIFGILMFSSSASMMPKKTESGSILIDADKLTVVALIEAASRNDGAEINRIARAYEKGGKNIATIINHKNPLIEPIYAETALTTAALRGNLKALVALVRLGANVNAGGSYGRSPLLMAVHHPDAFFVLLRAGAIPTDYILSVADKEKDPVKRQAVLEKIKQFDREVQRMHTKAVSGIPKAVVKHIIAPYVGHQSLFSRIIFERLREAAAENNLQKINAIEKEAYDAGIDINSIINEKDTLGGSPLSYAMRGDASLTKKMIALGADVNEITKDGDTILEAALNLAMPDVISVLLDAGARVTPKAFKIVENSPFPRQYRHSDQPQIRTC